ncbi:ATPase Transcriptional regulator, LuxR family [Mycobacterium xenopi]|uniref:LuxR family transcriptional regulator n=1 Tax=Mycobacterium xenopi TaxID=1789 RepID=A0AAD1H180_MYCXE|nr:LuxR family transcriptional regulator [Mycobacterium xenopi]SPX78438.1 ATPase Transcriptional regulator, LuxR family [Mycobacterium xenopi]
MQAASGSTWPVVARDEEFRQALAVLQDADAKFRGVVLLGDGGVGKSTLARAVADAVESSGQTVRFVLGTQTGRAVPLGAFSRLVTVAAAQSPAAMLGGALKTLETDPDLVLVVDDAHLLDPLSASLVYQLAAGGSTQLIVTIRSGEPVLDAVTALMKERLLLTMHIDPFTREQTEELARRVLGDAIAPRLLDELHRRSGGNVLLLRGLLSAGRETGVLFHAEDGWQLRGPLHPDRELDDLLEFRLRSLAPEELEAVEILAIGELLDWEVLRGLCNADAVERLERRGIIQLVPDGPAAVARLNHPIIGEAAIRLAGVVRSHRLNSMLAQAFRKHLERGDRRLRLPDVRGQIRLAQFIIHSDLEPDLDAIISAAVSAVTMSSLRNGEELARFAVERGGGLQAALVLADALSWQGRGDEAESVLAGADPVGADEFSTLQWGCLRAANLFWGCGQVESAKQVLVEVKDRVESEACIALAKALEVSFAFFFGDITTAIETGPALCASDALPLAKVWAAVATTCALAVAGRLDQVQPIAEAGLRAAGLSESGPQRFAIGVAEVMASTSAGDYAAAQRVWERYATMAGGVPEADAMVEAIHGLVYLARGELPSACAAFHNSLSALSGGFLSAWMMLVAAWSAQAEGARGNAAGAVAALERSQAAHGPQVAAFTPELELARAWERASVGETTAAVTHSLRAAQIARRSQMYAVEMRALHTAVRFGDRSQASRLAELAGMLGNPLSEAIAAHAQGLASHDGELLDTAADRFAGLGALACAADAAAQAAREHARSGRRGKELESSTRAHWLAIRGEVRTPAVKAAVQPLPITDREREIAVMVAAGLSNRQIADRLSVSVRTVDGHLYRIFAKLDIQSREQLARLLGGSRSGT